METKIKTINQQRGAFLEFRTDIVKLKNQQENAMRDLVLHPGGVCIICNIDQKMLCVKQYRYALNMHTIELPAGKLELDEDIYAAINRELIEETGYEAKAVEYLGPFIPAPGFCNEVIHMFYSDQVEVSANHNNYQPDADEDLEVLLLSAEELTKLLNDQQLGDYKTAFGFLYFLQRSNQ